MLPLMVSASFKAYDRPLLKQIHLFIDEGKHTSCNIHLKPHFFKRFFQTLVG